MAKGKDSKKNPEALLNLDPDDIIDELEGHSRGDQSGRVVAATGSNTEPEGKHPLPETSGVKRSQSHGAPTESVGVGKERAQDPAMGGGKETKVRRPHPATPRPTCQGPNCMKMPKRSRTGGFKKFCGPRCEHLAR